MFIIFRRNFYIVTITLCKIFITNLYIHIHNNNFSHLLIKFRNYSLNIFYEILAVTYLRVFITNLLVVIYY